MAAITINLWVLLVP